MYMYDQINVSYSVNKVLHVILSFQKQITNLRYLDFFSSFDIYQYTPWTSILFTSVNLRSFSTWINIITSGNHIRHRLCFNLHAV